ncbi:MULTISPECIES: ABC transporter permease [Paenibacillus]|uniref:Sugar ABC transporter permease n=2 Tax=Paenibacillus TaxID=44249 RepID=A0A4Q9E2T8_9BACL|nr:MULTISPECIES: ABC transporter permease subunit [Paenibacillus]TBL81981.1 sugar ABC transporter permease [Paenibacillus thalictri]UQZ87515.1 putative multiple-sugar transport system permease YteP [Paenibacillus konkukensis]
MEYRLKTLWKFKMLYLFLIPGMIYYVVFRYFPMYGVVIAFKDFSIMDGIVGSGWANPWYKHFVYFYESPYFTQLLSNTLLISVYKLVFGTIPPIVLALLLNECAVRWFKSFVQTVTYMPYFLSWVIISGILIALLSQNSGVVNYFIKEAGGESVPFLTSTEYFRSILIASDIWQSIGYNAIIYLAAITGIDATLYEAARVDGASRLRMIWSITLPGIRNVIILLVVLKLGHIMDAGFEQIYILYNIQVYPVADILDTWVFRTGLQQMNFSLASAVGLFKSVIGLVLVVLANSLAKRWGENVW